MATSMIIDDLDVLRTSGGPGKADAKLVVDSDTVLSGTIALQCLKVIPWRNTQICDSLRYVQSVKLAASHSMQYCRKQLPRRLGGATIKHIFCRRIRERKYHGPQYSMDSMLRSRGGARRT
jgi:hypothetical protein